MPDLKTMLHLNMLQRSKKRRKSTLARMYKAAKKEWRARHIYGLEWGDPDVVEPLKFVRDRYVVPYVNADHTAVEIGPGGGRWTRYMLGFKKLTIVDYHAEMLEELETNFKQPNMDFVNNNGTDFPGIEAQSIDYLFSFGTFVHLNADIVEAYLMNAKSILRPGANAIIHYSDKTKTMARLTDDFAENTPERMRKMVRDAGYKILEEDVTTMWHSSIVRFTV